MSAQELTRFDEEPEAFASLGFTASNDEVDEMIRRVDIDGSKACFSPTSAPSYQL